MGKATVKEATCRLEMPLKCTCGSRAWLRIRTIDPVAGAILQLVNGAAGDHHVDADARLTALFSNDEQSDDTSFQIHSALCQSLEKKRDHANMTEAVSCASSVQLIALHRQLEGVSLPCFRICRHNIHMRADQPSASGIGVSSGIGDLEVWAIVFVDERLDDQRAAIFDREGFQHLQQVRDYPALVGDQSLTRVILNVNRLADELRQEADVLILIEVEPGEQRR
mmetsp:Transcript_19744/g.46717  ORF Transcript_19744/g.46717 Transcript_19744/m.46717 type:complete len:224 (+) Transcript_19744:762-1433(+)